MRGRGPTSPPLQALGVEHCTKYLPEWLVAAMRFEAIDGDDDEAEDDV